MGAEPKQSELCNLHAQIEWEKNPHHDRNLVKFAGKFPAGKVSAKSAGNNPSRSLATAERAHWKVQSGWQFRTGTHNMVTDGQLHYRLTHCGITKKNMGPLAAIPASDARGGLIEHLRTGRTVVIRKKDNGQICAAVINDTIEGTKFNLSAILHRMESLQE